MAAVDDENRPNGAERSRTEPNGAERHRTYPKRRAAERRIDYSSGLITWFRRHAGGLIIHHLGNHVVSPAGVALLKASVVCCDPDGVRCEDSAVDKNICENFQITVLR